MESYASLSSKLIMNNLEYKYILSLFSLGAIKSLLDSYMVGAKSKSLAFVCKVRAKIKCTILIPMLIRVGLDICTFCKRSPSLQQSY